MQEFKPTHIYKGKQERFFGKPCQVESFRQGKPVTADVSFEDGQVARYVDGARLEPLPVFKPTHMYIGNAAGYKGRPCFVEKDDGALMFTTIKFADGKYLYPLRDKIIPLDEIIESGGSIYHKPKESDDRNFKPDHYHSGGIDAWTYIEANLNPQMAIGFHLGNVLKYVARHEKKNGLEDLKKAQDSLKEAIRLYEKSSVQPDKS